MTQGFIYDQYGNHASKHQDGGVDEISVTGLSGLLADDQHVLDAEVLAVAAAKTHGATHLPAGADPIGLPKFSAHKNGINQTGVVSATWTKVTFTTEEYDDASKYDAPNSKWTPGIIGKAHISANIHFTDMVDQAELNIVIYKNGGSYKRTPTTGSGTAPQGGHISCDVLIDVITDYFEIYCYHNSGSDRTIQGPTDLTWFMGHMLP